MIAWIKNIWGRVTSPFYKMLTPQQEQHELLGAINNLNSQAFHLNKAIAPNEGVKGVPLAAGVPSNIPQQAPPPPQQIQQPVHPVQQAPVQHVQQAPVQHVQQAPVQPQQDLSPLIDRVTSLEKQVTRFVNLIERNVAKNAKEITIRIKLNEDNDSTNSK